MPWGRRTGEVAPTKVARTSLLWSLEKRWDVGA